MVDTCVGSEFNGHMSAVPTNVVLLIIGAALNFYVRAVVYYVENIDTPPQPGKEKHTSFGFGAKGPARTMATLGLAFSVPELILWFVFYGIGDKNGLEFACQIESGFAFIPALIIGYFAFMMWATNFMRIFTRHSFAKVIMPYINPIEAERSPDEVVSRVALIPSYRGIWFPPIINQYNAKCSALSRTEQRKINNEYVAVDCYKSIYNPENSVWFTANMILEHCLPPTTPGASAAVSIPHKLSILWTNFQRFDLEDNSMDSLVVPIGGLMAYLSSSYGKEETPEQKHARAVAFLIECKRVLRDGGTLIASNLFFSKGAWMSALKEAGFNDNKEVDELVWWSYLPAKVTVSYKREGEVSISGSSSSGGKAMEATTSALHSTSNPAAEEDNRGSSLSQVSRFEVSTTDEAGSSYRVASLSKNPNTKIVVALFLFTLVLYIIFVLITYLFLDSMEVPTMLPYGEMVSSLFISNCSFIPIGMYGMVGELLLIVTPVSQNEFTDSEHYYEKQRHLVYQVFWKHLTNILVVVTIVTGLGWVPFFVLDYILIEGANQSTNTVANVNIGVGIAVACVLIPTLQFLYNWYMKREKAQEEEMKSLLNIAENKEGSAAASPDKV